MSRRFSPSFKKQAVEKLLSRDDNTSASDVAHSLGIGVSTIEQWKLLALKQILEPTQNGGFSHVNKEKRPQDWSLTERLNMVIKCSSSSEEELNAHCREQGVFPHHVAQWKLDFENGTQQPSKAASRNELKLLKNENKILQKELNRKDKALAETAALLVLQKKVHEIWGTDEDS